MSVTAEDSLSGLSKKSIDRANKCVQNLGSWEEARGYAKRRIKELEYSLRVFSQKIKDGELWPGTQKENAGVASLLRDAPSIFILRTCCEGRTSSQSDA